ncbi:histidine protein methyltransferase 1 [Dorcoceras hygrometricum]|uniref:protein-histidine N-methyltransferase n=1 Tax=Dorcoceras hygrometricum TaxID=472368 RepID=A0A2Z7AKH1_9LAMI|nr:histidine protein methyltransferase 1 [Dorcoceras hygrometricum]
MESNRSNSSNASLVFRLFDENPNSELGILDSPQRPLQAPPPCFEVLPSEVPTSVKYVTEPLNVGGVILLKGRVSTHEVFALGNSDLVPGKYEGGLKLWEGSLDLITALSCEIKVGKLSFAGQRVLELGCGHGLPGIFACQKGAASVHFQDFNAEVLQSLTIPNVNANVQKMPEHLATDTNKNNNLETRFFAGDWGEVHSILPYACKDETEASEMAQLNRGSSYDVILMAETVYSISALPNLCRLIKKCLCTPQGVVYMAAKKYYFGVGGGSRRFLSLVENDGTFSASLVSEVADGSSNVREVWKLLPK